MIIYTSIDGQTRIDVRLEDETLWLTQAQMCELYQTSKSNVSEHIKHIFEEGELEENSVVRKFRTTASDGKSYNTTYYNLDMIIALGYRIKSVIATRFRQWATQRLKEYMIKGFTLDDERLKKLGGGGYWKELLERIRDIRATEKVFYRQVLEIYATSIDYDPRASVSQEFFKKVQNKIHYAVHGHTASELILERADAEKDFMGLLTFKGAQPTLAEAKTAKNYLDEKELRAMGQLVSGYLDFAGDQYEKLFGKEKYEILFIPYAKVAGTYDAYEKQVQDHVQDAGRRQRRQGDFGFAHASEDGRLEVVKEDDGHP